MLEPIRTVVAVDFAGGRARDGPLTHGQRNTLAWVADETDPFSAVLHWRFALPTGATLADISAALAVLLARHEALRTCYPAGAELQRIAGAGRLPIELVELGSDSADDDRVFTDLVASMRAAGIDYTSGLPVRVAVALRADRPVVAAAIYSHLAVDFASMALIGKQFSELVADPAARAVGEPGHQPLDQAELEQSRHGQRQAETALRYWEGQLRQGPQATLPLPRPAVSEPGHHAGLLFSPAAGAALAHLSARTGAGRQSILLAGLCALLARRTGSSRCTFATVSGNRFRLRLRDYVGTLAQDGLFALALDRPGFDDLARRANRASLAANTNSVFDSTRLWPIIDQVGADRGTAFARDFTFNDVSAQFAAEPVDQPLVEPADLPAMLAQSTVQWLDSPPFPVLLMCNPIALAPALHLALTADTTELDRAEVETLLRGLDKLLVAGASGDVQLDRLGEL
ncbi:MAG: condensation domain-containing protein, partial [Jatrophihabitantaceae bacterium]